MCFWIGFGWIFGGKMVRERMPFLRFFVFGRSGCSDVRSRTSRECPLGALGFHFGLFWCPCVPKWGLPPPFGFPGTRFGLHLASLGSPLAALTSLWRSFGIPFATFGLPLASLWLSFGFPSLLLIANPSES